MNKKFSDTELASHGWEHMHLSGFTPPPETSREILVEIGRLTNRIADIQSPTFNVHQDGYMQCENEWRQALGVSDLGEAVVLFRKRQPA